jgi:multidrug efflux system membrane fusion protein
MRRRTVIIAGPAVAALLGGAVLVYSAAGPDQSSAAIPPAPPSVPVVAEAVKQGDVPIYMRGIGTVQAYNTATVHSQITGPITEIAFKEGQVVHKGDLLAVIDPRPFQAQLDQAIANQARDQAQLANAQQLYQRNSALLTKGWSQQRPSRPKGTRSRNSTPRCSRMRLRSRMRG